MLGYKHGEGEVINNIKPTISEKSNLDVTSTENLKAEDCPGVGKLLVGPNGPVDASAAAKVAAAGTMPNIPSTTQAVLPPSGEISGQAKPAAATSLSEKPKSSAKQSVLRCDCCFVTVNSQHQLDLHLNGNSYFCSKKVLHFQNSINNLPFIEMLS